MKAIGIYKGFETKNGFYTAIIEDTGLESSPGKRTRWFNAGKATNTNPAPTTAAGTRVEFEYTTKEHENGNTYYSIKGSLKELGAATSAQSSSVASGHSGSTNASIENQVALKAAVEFALGNDGDLKLVVEAFKTFQGLLQPTTTTPAKPEPKPIEEQSQDPDDDIPY